MNYLLLAIVFLAVTACNAEEKPIVVVVPSHNNEALCEKNLNSICTQHYTNYHVLYVDDASTDGTADTVAAYVAHMNLQDRVTIIKNPVRRGALYSIYLAVQCCPDEVIVMVVDGDDWLVEDNSYIFQMINEIYDDLDIWMTYGQFIEYPSGKKGFCKPIPDAVKKSVTYRYYDWVSSHLKTFYAGLFKAIPIGQFIREGSFLRAACDYAFMMPILELAGGRAYCVPDVIYVYNMQNNLNVCRTRPVEQLKNNYWVRTRTPLQPLEHHPAQGQFRVVLPLYNIHLSTQGPEQCRAYLETLYLTDINTDYVSVWYDSSMPETVQKYQAIASQFHIELHAINGQSSFKGQLQSYVHDHAVCSGILLTCDGCIWRSQWSGAEALSRLAKTGAVCYSCTRGLDSCYDDFIEKSSFPCVPLDESIWAWKPHESRGLWHMPYVIPGFLCSYPAFETLLSLIRGGTLTEFLYNMPLLSAAHEDDVVLCNLTPSCVYNKCEKCV